MDTKQENGTLVPIKKPGPVGVRAAEKHSGNPFMTGGLVQIKGKKKFYNIASKGEITINREGQVIGGVQHSIVRIVDDSKFVKLFEDGVAAHYDLGRSGAKVFKYLYAQVQAKPSIDKLYLYFMDALEEPWAISKPVFFKGMAELLDKNFLAKSTNPNMFYLNPLMLWNGDRFKFVQEYRRESSEKKIANSNEKGLIDVSECLEIDSKQGNLKLD